MSGIETRLAQSLAARAGRGQVEVGELAGRAMTTAGRIRTRRRVAGGAALVVLVMAAAFGVRAVLPERNDTTLPVALGVPSALSRPEGIGEDPGLLHFDLDMGKLPGDARASIVVWSSEEERESVAVYAADDRLIAAVHLAPSALDLRRGLPTFDAAAVDTTVGGRPGKVGTVEVGNLMPYADLRWEPRDGIFAAVWARDRATAERVFDAVRLDRVQRCVTPMRLSALPAGASWTECQTALRVGQVPGRYVWAWSTLMIWQGGVEWVQLWAGERGNAQFKQDRVVAGRPAQWLTDGMRGLWIPGFGPVSVHILEGNPYHADLLSEEEAVWYAERLQISEDLTNPDAWPTSATR